MIDLCPSSVPPLLPELHYGVFHEDNGVSWDDFLIWVMLTMLSSNKRKQAEM